MDKEFMLQTDAASDLYHNHAAKMPIIDYHCHINPREIAEDLKYSSITELWLGGDHYKWRIMRANGVPESELTGAVKTDPLLVFRHWAQALSRAIGNPLYHWSHLELKRYFGIDEVLRPENAVEIFDRCNKLLSSPDMSVRGIIKRSNVKLICTTDDPTDDLIWHKKLKEDKSFDVKVLPAFRPDKALNIDKAGFLTYIASLADVSGVEIKRFNDVKTALEERINYFHNNGCRVSDHALDYPLFTKATENELEDIFRKAVTGEPISELQVQQYKTALILFLAEQYNKRDWVMQIHFGCLRSVSASGIKRLGPDTGFDSIGNSRGAGELAALLDAMQVKDALPKMVLYSLNQYDNEIIMAAAGSFLMDSACATRIQLGSAWWYNDHKLGMEKQITDFANQGVLGNFIGMLTDSRSFISYTRHEYFRRILCNVVGGWMETGELPNDSAYIGALIEDISYNNADKFFGFNLK